MNLAYRDVRYNLLRFILTCLGLSLLMAVVLAMMGIYNGLVADSLNNVRAPKAGLWVVEAGRQGPFAESSKIPGETQDAVARLYGVRDAGSITYQTVEAPFAGRRGAAWRKATSRRLPIASRGLRSVTVSCLAAIGSRSSG